MEAKQYHLTVIGLGYVGLPLAVEFAKKYPVVGFDINKARIAELRSGNDHTLEISSDQLAEVLKKKLDNTAGLWVSDQLEEIKITNVFIITVPTPVDKYNRPDLTPLVKASETVGRALKKGDIVIYESTVYPGVTEEECVPILEKVSGLTFNKDFFAGYSPERINPGDKEHTVTKIKKVTSGSTPEAAKIVNDIYSSIIVAGTHMAPSIKVAEAAKVIENAQRDINIAFINELAKIFNLLDIDTQEVLAAASTKWNFLPFRPGLVGGHCIGVDPYYLAQKAMEVGYHPEIILAGRRLNDGMGAYVAGEVIKLMVKKSVPVYGSKALVLGITFKENCPDVRNTKVIDIIRHLQSYHVDVDVYDPWANPDEVMHEYGVKTVQELPATQSQYNAVILAVAHKQFGYETIKKLCSDQCVLFDVKAHLGKDLVDARL
ncbi:UDP-N-acetyl-D-galactosamine dehydrogenase [Niastella yeongjuensis]|uniref:UDP-N-acetyl-D-galactosamine dehydrogenase n=1 Tax=Niastella yeongjuensis TaxID=354355 RepID=A0A1V9EMG1_9BACT|nr:nucleotide sugar dehydrogenase [Niastella yeongjuensis]OQP47343.1 UDP-N-acetyl-D-galactosamine dehydrogenase [Niastella yeongjuensis]SEN79633.1 UDP-N-acetyl-D-galactosamine dehydrogenase [Niastella yeongjuensis]